MEPHDAAERLERGLAAAWDRQVRWVPGSTAHRLGGLLVALTGVADQTQQVAVVDEEVTDPEAAVTAAEVAFRDAAWRPAFDLLRGRHPHLEAVLRDRGYQMVVSRPGMARRTSDLAEISLPIGFGVGPASVDDRAAVVAVQRDAFDLDERVAEALVSEAMFTDPGVTVLVVRAASGAVVGSAVAHHTGDTGALVGAAVARGHRRRGLGAALTTTALSVGARHDCDLLWLQSTDDGLPVYRRLGFWHVAPCDVWLR